MRKLLTYSPFHPDILVYSDLHLHERKEFTRVDPETGLNSRLAEGLDVLRQINQLLKKHPSIELLINLGDVFELKDRVPTHILLEFQKALESIPVDHFLLRGNHDFNLPNYPIPRLFWKLTLIERSEYFKMPQGTTLAFIPFQREEADFWKEFHKMKQMKPDFLFFHQEIPGVEYESGIQVPGSVPGSTFDRDTVYMSGHIHKHQTVKRVNFIGSPYQTKFSDEGIGKYVWLIDRTTKVSKGIKLNYPEFKSFNLQELRESRGQVLSQVWGQYVKVTGEAEQYNWTPEEKKQIRADLEENGAIGVTFSIQVKHNPQTRIPKEKVEDDEAIIRLYAEDFQDSGLDKERLTEVGLDLFHNKH